MKNSSIEWTHDTFNPWMGCTKVSPACDNCYAETFLTRKTRYKDLWSGDRQRTKTTWRDPVKLNRKAVELGARYRMFCASLADVFDNQVPTKWRED